MWLADLHVHSNFSDGKMSVRELVDFYGRKGFGAIAITDHLCEESSWLGRAGIYLNRSLTRDSFSAYMETIATEAERARKLYDLLVLPGVELTKNSFLYGRSAHILAIGITDFISADDDVITIAHNAHEQGALVIAAHPVSTRKLEPQTYYLWDRRDELKNHFDACEVASGPFYYNEVFASGLPIVATSDLHSKHQINSWKTVFRGERSKDNVFDSVREQNIHFEFYKDESLARTCSPATLARELC